ncbi:MAG: caspase family protein [Gemmataceae bacterium]|nr:caspase family protein [Gemmata sp.]MDW8197983.1 caspase family protein [Gemmataceae bacterium]
MSALKVRCPECQATLRLQLEGTGEHDVECPRCGHEFTAVFQVDRPDLRRRPPDYPTDRKTAASAGRFHTRHQNDNYDDEDSEDSTGNPTTKWIIAGVAAAVLVVGGIVGVIVAFRGSDTDTTAQTDTTAKTDDPPNPTAATNVPAPPQPNPSPAPNPSPPQPKINPPSPPPSPPPPINPNPPPTPKPQPPTKNTLPGLPPPPKIRISGSLVPETKPIVKAPAIPPLADDEDPFVRARNFVAEGPLPKLPPLPERQRRPLLILDAGGHTDLIGKVFFTPQGDRVITVGQDKAVRIWDPVTNETLKTIRFPAGPGREGSLLAAAMSRSGKRLAVAGEPVGKLIPGKVPIYIIDPETGAMAGAPLEVGMSTILTLHYSNDGKWLGVGCDNGYIQLVNVANRTSLKERPSPAPVLEVKFNPNPKAQILACLGADNFVQIFHFDRKTPHREFPLRGLQATTLAWSNDGQTLAIGTKSGEILLGNVAGVFTNKLPPIEYAGRPVAIHQMQFLPGDREIAVVGVGGAGWAGIVNLTSGQPRLSFTQHTNTVFAVDVSPAGDKIATSGGSQHETFVWKSNTGDVVNRFVGSGQAIWALAWSKDGKSLAWGTSNVRDANREGRLEHTFRLDSFGIGDPPDPAKYTQTVTSDDHVKIITGSRGFEVQTTGRPPQVMLLNGGEKIYSATVLPKGNAVVVAGAETLALINPATARETHRFIGHTGNILCVTPSPDGQLFATGSSDQTIRIWQRDQEDPLLSIFISGRDWIAWTPQGYYACSGQGERLIAWQVTGSNKAQIVHPAERFRASMYQPALLKYIVPAGDIPRALAMAQKYDKALIQTTNVADVIPPEVTLEGFDDTELKVNSDTLIIKAKATSAKHPIESMRLLVDGRPYLGTAGVKRFTGGLTTVEASWEVALTPGLHTFAVIADSGVSKGMSKVGLAVKSGPIPKPNLYVLAVGVSDYPGDLKLRYCASDAQQLATAFQTRSQAVFNRIEVKILTDKQATKKGILDGLDWLQAKMTPHDVGIVSFSGHGTTDAYGHFYLCPHDLNLADRDGSSLLSGKLFKDRLDAMPGRLVAILDACHSGRVAEKGPPVTDTLVRDLTAADSGVIVMCASAGREFSLENPLTKAGFYTFGLVEGLSGHADIDGDGLIYIHELDLYARARVRQLSGGTQNPTLGRPQTVRPFPIAKVEQPAGR